MRFCCGDLPVEEGLEVGRVFDAGVVDDDLAAGGFDQSGQLFHGTLRGALGPVHAERIQSGQNRTFFSGFCAFYGNQACLSNEHNPSIIYHATI